MHFAVKGIHMIVPNEDKQQENQVNSTIYNRVYTTILIRVWIQIKINPDYV